MELESVLKEWGGETLVTHYDNETGAWIIIAVHSTERGPAAGGTRMMNYDSLEEATEDALKLSKAMTYKFATVNMQWGGGKTVILTPPGILTPEERKGLLLRFGSLVKGLNGRYYAGPDIGTSSGDMDVLYQTAGPYVFSRTEAAGGAGSSSIPTAHGVFAGIQASCDELYGASSPLGKTVLVQGAGNVGGLLMELLRKAGAKVLFTETNEDRIHKYSVEQDYQYVNPNEIYKTACDIFAPCAQGGILSSETIPLLKCKAVVGAANNQLATPEDAERLRERGILYAPDYVVSLGGAMGITIIEAEGVPKEESFENVKKAISGTLAEIYKKSKEEGITTVKAAEYIAVRRIEKTKAKQIIE
ncbi:Glu/Leu/Phe/Val dehydrogenase family protein [Leptobacterium sp. I13]|uniref:Glu/Leu/Phe/Val dehydrogenase family protein n=1 Tax=Leptobacterium meishanense TaxID=3128904 RepID=UPI0030ECE20C